MSGEIVPDDGQDPPNGSEAQDYQYAISDTYLNLLSSSTKNSLLSISNIGSTTTSKIINTLQIVENLVDFEVYTINASSLNSLLNNSLSSAFSVTNVGSSRLVKIIIVLGEITPTGANKKMLITNNTTTYQLVLSNTTSEKRIVFNEIPSTFVNSFYVVNQTGVTLSSGGNSIFVIPI